MNRDEDVSVNVERGQLVFEDGEWVFDVTSDGTDVGICLSDDPDNGMVLSEPLAKELLVKLAARLKRTVL